MSCFTCWNKISFALMRRDKLTGGAFFLNFLSLYVFTTPVAAFFKVEKKKETGESFLFTPPLNHRDRPSFSFYPLLSTCCRDGRRVTVTKRILIQSENNNKKREKKGMGRGKGRQKKITYTGTVAKERERYLYDVRTAWSHQMEFESFSSFYVKKKMMHFQI